MTAVAGEEAARKTANRALNTARKALKVVPVDAAPEVVALNTELSTGEAGLKTAQGILEVARGANKGVKVTVTAIGSSTAFALRGYVKAGPYAVQKPRAARPAEPLTL